MHALHRVLLDAVDGRFPPVDGGVDIVAPMAGDHHAVVEFTGHSFVLAARGSGGGRLAGRHDLDDHPRVVRSRHHRRDVDVYGDETGVVTIGRGLVDRSEVSVEVFPAGMAGAGRRLIVDTVGLVPAGEIVFAQVAPGNAASLRALLSCGFALIGAETLLLPTRK